ncbi:hemolymph juvenile hormone-binding protein [Oryctes borbonicus]|uniref:Hemolymph juvenile hormone-binding protein n=1 Tax=Oryctes borbonicus TaxID=1629725 RepID=A0A0T6BAE7_9SCAR|nr:hemolymph juvenile hormone-binding protein [Oryctes borbonicus]
MRLLLASLLVICGCAWGQKLPSYVIPCVRTKPDFHQCSIDNGIKAIPYILKGDKQYKIPPLAPLKVPQVSIQPNDNLKITLTDLVISGIETAKLEDVLFDFDKKIIKVKLLMEYLMVLGNYEIDGRLLVQLRGSGPLNITTELPSRRLVLNISFILLFREQGS